MIARVEGVLSEKEPSRVVVDVRGVGYELLVSLSTFVELPDAGKTVALQVHTHLRDDAIQLFGFLTAHERAAFELLLRANRVGPKLAQTILSGIAPRALVEAIRDGDVGVLRGVPGIGPKMAERIAVELRERAAELAAAGAPVGSPTHRSDAVPEQALSALVNLGYPRAQAERVIRAAGEEAGQDASIEALIRSALRRLAR